MLFGKPFFSWWLPRIICAVCVGVPGGIMARIAFDWLLDEPSVAAPGLHIARAHFYVGPAPTRQSVRRRNTAALKVRFKDSGGKFIESNLDVIPVEEVTSIVHTDTAPIPITHVDRRGFKPKPLSN